MDIINGMVRLLITDLMRKGFIAGYLAGRHVEWDVDEEDASDAFYQWKADN